MPRQPGPARALAPALACLLLAGPLAPQAAASGAKAVTAHAYWHAPAAPAGTPAAAGVPRSFWASGQIRWALRHRWIRHGGARRFRITSLARRAAAARVLALASAAGGGSAVSGDPYAQAVAAAWLRAGAGRRDTLSQLDLDRGAVRMLGLTEVARRYGTLHTADGYRPRLPRGFGVEQVARHLGLRVNAPQGSDRWEWWPRDRLRRVELAVEAYQLAHLPGWVVPWAAEQADVAGELPAWTPLQRQVLGLALRSSGAPYVWGGTSDHAQTPLGLPAAGGFDCSGFVWWVLRLHSYRLADGSPWSGADALRGRSTYDMARDLPVSRRVRRSRLRPGDVLFWTDGRPRGVHASWRSIVHAGLYLGAGWAIDSHGGGDGVTIDSIARGAGWYDEQLAFGWHVLPRGE